MKFTQNHTFNFICVDGDFCPIDLILGNDKIEIQLILFDTHKSLNQNYFRSQFAIMGLSISHEGIHMPGLSIDSNGIAMPGLTINENGIRMPFLSVGPDGIQMPTMTVSDQSLQISTSKTPNLKPFLWGAGIGALMGGLSVAYLLNRRQQRRNR